MLDNVAIKLASAATRVIEILGISIISLGVVLTLSLFSYRVVSGADRQMAVKDLRSNLGRAILLGLEFLVAADIINTVAIEPSLESVVVLGGIVAIRTFLSFSLETEIEGRPPWRRAQD